MKIMKSIMCTIPIPGILILCCSIFQLYNQNYVISVNGLKTRLVQKGILFTTRARITRKVF